ncbi:hypothetical protein GCM10010149_33220 [Nonomuraea roseoviolacea subsp. roseoviolacea]|uniref:hypothetical protein n=1 Tax=Nonomuraea roseoviolacea TaxID=103837 RepID=UPI0031D5820C
MTIRQHREQPSPTAFGLSGLEIAAQWAQLPAEHLQVALKALDPQLKREHEYRMAQLDKQEREIAARRTHMLHMTGIVAGFAIAVGMLVAAVLLGMNNQPWLAVLLSGPSILALIKVFVLRSSGSADMEAMKAAQKAASQNILP